MEKPTPEFWERQPGETSKAFYAFTMYRDMGAKRSLTNVARMYNAETNMRGQMARWSRKWRWVERSHAYDNHLDGIAREEKEAVIKKMKARHLTLSLALQSKAASRLQGLDGKDMRVRDAISAIIAGAKLERLTRGEVTERIEAEIAASPELKLDWDALNERDKKQLIRAARIIIKSRSKKQP